MLNNIEVEVLEQLLENDRLQKQLFQELCTQILDDDHGIPQGAYDTLCELADTFGLIIEGIDRIGACDGRVYMKEAIDEPEDDPSKEFEFDVAFEYTDDSCWEWAEEQDIATIEDIRFVPSPKKDVTHTAGKIEIVFHWDDQNTIETRTKMAHDFKIKAVAGK